MARSEKCRKGVVTSGHPEVSRAAAAILEAGGNAFDAVVAAGFAAAVAEPGLSSLGGGGFLLARSREGEEILFDFFVDTPGLGRDTDRLEPYFFPVTVQFAGAQQDFNVGLGAVAVPGCLKGYLHVHQRLGSLPLATLLAPAVRLAREGVLVNRAQASFFRVLEPILTLEQAGRALYQDRGVYLKEGSRFCNPDLGRFLETLAGDRGESFYAGALAYQMAADMQEGQGLLTYDDLAGYQVIERAPLSVTAGPCTLLTNPKPSLGGNLIGTGFALGIETGLFELAWGSADQALAMASLQVEMERLRTSGLDEAEQAAAASRLRSFRRGTTHVSICDAEGNVASMTTSNGEGSGYIVPGTGIMLNNMMGEDDLHPAGFHASPPGLRVASMMSPSLLLEDATVRLVLGSGGSKRIRTAILQVLAGVLFGGLDPQRAVDAPRMHWDGEVLQVEPGFPEPVLATLQNNFPVNLWPRRDIYFGGVHAASPSGTGGADPRRGGAVQRVTV